MPLDLHPGDITELADTVAELVIEKLGQSVISSVLPTEIGGWVRQAAKHGMRLQINQIYLDGPNYLIAEWRLNIDGTIMLELRGQDGTFMWRGTFRPEGFDG